ncbi:cytosolic protein [Bacillus thuringiensis]|uniref:cytosolic protein n=1 Tax=Bacillus thuringiensis TaxID=1428 RepID=UPI000BED8B01|nr:cytosolic protein [Bacillus thuringiensis]MBG9494158.1 cytosolic protein [Bacillus thuringiensis]PDY31883.1 cytosolic protein [Bacillus thuringiensis]PFE27600.1 cytosolic protein [Bacillus thuringiensis]PFT98532.1 cytosolic protein [Bacillus thuringiensis]PGO21486.1 cytosolic protein [Bacillus thuringiensis]
MKKKINAIATKETFHNLSTFKEVEELNKTIRAYRDNIRMSIKRTDVQSKLIALLEILKRHSCKYVGVSFLCKNSIAQMMEVSYKTVQRLMKKLVDLEMIKQIAMKRKKDMLQTSNAIIIQPTVEEVSNKVNTKRPTKCPTIKTKPVSLKQNIKDINKRNSDEAQSNVNDNDFIDYRVPQSMLMKLKTAFSSKIINESFRNAINIAKKAAKKFNLLADTDVFHNLLANASSVLFSKTHEYEHNGTLIKNPIGYFTRTFKKIVYHYIDSFREIHHIAKRKENIHTGPLAIFKRMIED